MVQEIEKLLGNLKGLAEQNPYIAAGIGIVYLLFLIKRTKKTLKFTFFGSILLVVGLWFLSMYGNRNNNKNWNRYENQRLNQIEKSGAEK